MTPKRPRVLVADDHVLLLDGLRRLLDAEFQLVGTVEDGRSLVKAARELKPDVIVLDISMPGLNGLEASRQIGRMDLEAKIVFLTMHADLTYVSEAFRAGASAYVLKRSAASELSQAIWTVLRGKTYVTPLLTAQAPLPSAEALRGAVAESTGRLTPRQREVLQLVAEGRSSKEIAAVLGISSKTVEFHKSAIMARLDLRSAAALTKYALDHGIIGG